MRRTVAVALMAGCLACGGDGPPGLPAGPSPLVEGVVLYEDANFAGASAHLTSSTTDLKDFEGPCKHEFDDDETVYDWNDCVSSVRVAPGWQVMVFEHPDYEGDRYMATTDVGNLQLAPGGCSHDGLNDCVSSVRVTQVR